MRADTGLSALNLSAPRNEEQTITMNSIEAEWRHKALHGRFAAALSSPDIDPKISTAYLTRGVLMPETEGFITAIQDQIIATRNYQKYIAKLDVPNDRCRLCNNSAETIQHLSSGCTYLAPKDYLRRHDRAGGIIHQAICKENKLVNELKPFYKYSPELVQENQNAKVLWNSDIITDRPVAHNRPDIFLFDRNENKGYIIDITVPLDDNVRRARMEKIEKYHELATEVKAIYQLVSVQIIPIVISSNGLTDKYLPDYLKQLKLPNVPNLIALMQKSVVLSTCSIIRKVLSNDAAADR